MQHNTITETKGSEEDEPGSTENVTEEKREQKSSSTEKEIQCGNAEGHTTCRYAA